MNGNLRSAKEIHTVLCAAVDADSLQYGLIARTVHGRSGTVLESNKSVLNLFALNYWVQNF